MFDRSPPLSEELSDLVTTCLPHWQGLDAGERTRLLAVAADLLGRCSWEPARGFALDEPMRATIAGHAALLGVGLGSPPFRNVTAIVVHPTTMVLTGERPGPSTGVVDASRRHVLGHTTGTGPVFVAWDVARRQAAAPGSGSNVVFHEFAHKLDVEDGVVDGTPVFADPRRRDRWVAVCQAELDGLRAGRGSPLVDRYAATNPGEFFAVVTEVFLDRPHALAEDRPELYEVFRDFYGQDPAGRPPPTSPDGARPGPV